MEHVVHQDYRPVKGPDGAHLVGQGGVEGVGLDGVAGEVRGVDLVGVQGLGDGVGHRHPPENLAEGHADALPQLAGTGGLGGHAVAGGDAPQKPLVDHPGGHGQHQASRIQLRQGPLEPPVGGPHGGQHPGIAGQGGLDGGLHVPGEDDGPAHVHRQQLPAPLCHRGGHEALEGQNLPHIGGGSGLGGAEEGVGVLLAQGQGEHLGEQQLAQIQLGRPLGHVEAADDQGTPAGLGPDEGGEGGAAQTGEELVGVQAAEAGEAQRLPALLPAQQQQVVPQPPQAPAQIPGVGPARQHRARQQGLRLLRQLQAALEGQILHPQQGLVLGLPEVEAPAVDELLGHGVDEVGDVPALVHRLPDAGGADVL